MITREGYSKDPGIRPSAVAITFGREMMQSQGGVKVFLKNFQDIMEKHEDGDYWMHKCSNLPAQEVDIIYIICLNRLYGKVYCGGYRRRNKDDTRKGYSANGVEKVINWNHIILSGPFIKCPFRRTLKGFQGFRYTEPLF